MFLRDIWNKQTMIDTFSRSFRGEGVFWLIHLVTGEPLSKGTTYDLCRHKKMLQRSPYTKVTFMNKPSRLRGLTCKQASHRATWNIYLEQISQMDRVVFHGRASQPVSLQISN